MTTKVEEPKPACTLLKEAREFLSEEDNWTQGVLYQAKSDTGGRGLTWRAVKEMPRKDLKCCALGALYLVNDGYEGHIHDARQALLTQAKILHEELPDNDKRLFPAIQHINDNMGYKPTLEMFDRAIAACDEGDE